MRAHDEEDLLWPFGDIVGFDDGDEDDEETDGDEESGDPDDEESEEGADDETDDEDDDDEDDESKSKKSTQGLKSALRKERMERKRLARELKKLQRTSPKPDEKSGENKEDEEEDEKSAAAVKKAEAAEERADKLAVKLATNAVDTVILKYANDFKDVNDVLQFVDRKEIDVDQDDDDPSVIEVDEESVKDAVKALRKSKPYLLKSETERTKSGSKFNGRKKDKTAISDEKLREKYSALRR